MSKTLSDKAYLQISQNNAKALQKMAQTFSREQWAWEKNMSSTAHQREVSDLQKAGLNPVLSSGGSGASYTSTSGDSGASASSGLLSSGLSSMAQMRSAKLSASASNYAARMNYKAAQANAAAQVRAASIAAAASIQNTESTNETKKETPEGIGGNIRWAFQKLFGAFSNTLAPNGRLGSQIMNSYFTKTPGLRGNVNKFNFYQNMTANGKNVMQLTMKRWGVKFTPQRANILSRFLFTQNDKYLDKFIGTLTDKEKQRYRLRAH